MPCLVIVIITICNVLHINSLYDLFQPGMTCAIVSVMNTIIIYKNNKKVGEWDITHLDIPEITPVLRDLHLKGFTFKIKESK